MLKTILPTATWQAIVHITKYIFKTWKVCDNGRYPSWSIFWNINILLSTDSVFINGDPFFHKWNMWLCFTSVTIKLGSIYNSESTCYAFKPHLKTNHKNNQNNQPYNQSNAGRCLGETTFGWSTQMKGINRYLERNFWDNAEKMMADVEQYARWVWLQVMRKHLSKR